MAPTPKLYPTFAEAHPSEVTVEGWVATSSTSGGRIIGFGNSQSGTSAAATNDLVLYVDSGNRLAFAQTTQRGTVRSVRSARTVNDGQWHHVAATAGADGISLFVDGRRVGRDQTPVAHAALHGLLAPPRRPDVRTCPTGRPTAPSTARSTRWRSTRRQLTQSPPPGALPRLRSVRPRGAPRPADAYSAAVNAQSPDAFWRLDETSGSSVLDSSASGQDGTVLAGVSWGAAGSPASATNRAATLNGTSGSIISRETVDRPEDLLVRAVVQDHHHPRRPAHRLRQRHQRPEQRRLVRPPGRACSTTAGCSSAPPVRCATSPRRPPSYNDNQWHHVVATQGADGMKLYVDGLQVATNAATDAASYTGYWRVGGDRCYGGQTSNYLAGTVDEAAVYATALTGAAGPQPLRGCRRGRPQLGAHRVLHQHQGPPGRSRSTGPASTDPDGTIASYVVELG